MKKALARSIHCSVIVSWFAMVLISCSVPHSAQAGVAPGGSSAFGRDLAGWMNIYWQVYFHNWTAPADDNLNSVVGNVVLMPLPNSPGDGTPASLAVTLDSGQSFVMPLFGFQGTSYSDGTPPDGFEPRSIFETLEIEFRIDGKVVIDASNVMKFYTQSLLEPPIPFAFPPLAALINQQSIGFAHGPLSPGIHHFQLHVRNTQPAYGFFAEYNNTWTVTVLPGRH